MIPGSAQFARFSVRGDAPDSVLRFREHDSGFLMNF